MGSSNSYMEEVLQQQQVVAQELKRKSAPAPVAQRALRGRMQLGQGEASEQGGGNGGSSSGVDVRVTGFWRFRTVLVPPNAWVVHTRRGAKEPLHLGLGVSFGFDPALDSYLVAPATMQTLAINARCICAERQGILVQAYVQWIVEDFKAAYQKLDFSDMSDPMRIVNVQLREQAEASIKDKVATMSIEEVLADKRPIIDELTARLRSVAEGQGLKIVQVQIKEAVISSTTVWENLQKPFREEKARLARMAELDRERAVNKREVEDSVETERARIAAEAETERMRRAQEVELLRNRAELEETRVTAEIAQIEAQKQVDAARAQATLAALEAELARTAREHEGRLGRERGSLVVEAERRKVENDVSAGRLDELALRMLPDVVSRLPKVDRSEHIHIGDGAPEGLATLMGLVKTLRGALVPRA